MRRTTSNSACKRFSYFSGSATSASPAVFEAELPNQTRARLRFEKLPFAAACGDPRLRQHGFTELHFHAACARDRQRIAQGLRQVGKQLGHFPRGP